MKFGLSSAFTKLGGSSGSLLKTIMDVFSTTAEKIGANWYFRNTAINQSVKQKRILYYGNSIVYRNLPSYLRANLKLDNYNDYDIRNLGVNSKTTAQMITDYNSVVAPLYDASKDCYVLLQEGTNSMYVNGDNLSAQDAYNQMITLAVMCKATGFITIIVTPTPAGSATDPLESRILDYIVLLQANKGQADYLINIRNDSAFSSGYNATYFTDNLHLNDAGKRAHAEYTAHYLINNVFTYPIIKSIQVKNRPCIAMPQTTGAGYFRAGNLWYADPYVHIIFKNDLDPFGTNQIDLAGRRTFSNALTDWYLKMQNGIIQMAVFESDALFTFANFYIDDIPYASEILDMEAWYDTTAHLIHIKCNGVEITQACTRTMRNVASYLTFCGGPYVLPPSHLYYCEFGSYTGTRHKWYISESQDKYIYADSGQVAELKTLAPESAWSTCNLEPYAYSLGVTIYRKTADNTFKKIIGNNNIIMAGYTREGYFPAESGVLEYLANLYNVPVDADINSVLTSGDYTFDQIDALVSTKQLIVTKDDDQITNLKVKIKQ